MRDPLRGEPARGSHVIAVHGRGAAVESPFLCTYKSQSRVGPIEMSSARDAGLRVVGG